MSWAMESIVAITLASLTVSAVMVCHLLQRIARALEQDVVVLPRVALDPAPTPTGRGRAEA